MSELRKVLEEQEGMLEKAINTGDISGTPGTADTLFSPVSLTDQITDVSRRKTPFVDTFLPRAKQGRGPAHVFNKTLSKDATPIDPREGFYGDGDLPNAISPSYDQVSVPFKSYGFSQAVTDLAVAQTESIVDLNQDAIEAAMQLVKEGLEFIAFWGDTTYTNGNSVSPFAGLNQLITNEVDAGGARLSGTTGKAIIDEAAERIAQNGGMATHMFTSVRTAQNINNTYSGNERVIVTESDRDDITWGELVPRVQTVAGTWDIVGDFFINPGNTFTLFNGDTSTPSGATTSTAFIIPEQYVNFVNLRGMELLRLGRRTDKTEFFVRIYTVLELIASEYCVKITNIDDTLA